VIGSLSSLLAVMLLTDPADVVDAEAAAALSEDADRVELAGQKKESHKSARITSRTSDFDRSEGVAMFEGDVLVRYSDDSTMAADRFFMFLSGSNELARVVALGHVVTSNETRTGTCALATYRRKKGEIEMFGDGKGTLAHLVERGRDSSELEGTRIKFWLDAEQVEVDNSQIGVKDSGGTKAL